MACINTSSWLKGLKLEALEAERGEEAMEVQLHCELERSIAARIAV